MTWKKEIKKDLNSNLKQAFRQTQAFLGELNAFTERVSKKHEKKFIRPDDRAEAQKLLEKLIEILE